MTVLQKVRDFFSPSRRLRRALQKLRDRWKGQFYEGAEPPPRLTEEVALFRLCYPRATTEQWRRFAERAIQNSYRDGFVRGYQWQERGWEGPAIDPEQLAEIEAHDWSLYDQGPRYDRLLNGVVPDDPLSHLPVEQRRAFLEQLDLIGGSPYQATVDLTPYEDQDDE